MPIFKIQLLDQDELKALEDTLFRALVRALRVAQKESLIAGYKPPEPEHVAPEPEFGRLMNGGNASEPERGNGNVVERYAKRLSEVVGDHPKPKVRQRRSLLDYCQVVEEPLPGFIPCEQARDIIGVPDSSYAQQILRTWVFDKRVEGVIVRSPGQELTGKGLDGELMVHRQQLMANNEQRQRNVHLAPRHREVH